MFYGGWTISKEDRKNIRLVVPDVHPIFVAHHITHSLSEDKNIILPKIYHAKVIRSIIDGNIQALVVEINGRTIRSDGNIYHITWTKQSGISSAYSNDLLSNKSSGIELDVPLLDLKPFISEMRS